MADREKAEALIEKGRKLRDEKDFEGAIAVFTEAIAADDSDDNAYFLRGLQYDLIEEYDKAIADFNKGLSLLPDEDSGRVYYYQCRSHAYSDKGEYDKAIADANDAIGLAADDEDTGESYEELAYAYYKKGDREQAIANYKKAIDYGDENAAEDLKEYLNIDYPEKPVTQPSSSKKFNIIGLVVLGALGFIFGIIGAVIGAVGGWFLGGIVGKKFFAKKN